jgi:hypothetical protein
MKSVLIGCMVGLTALGIGVSAGVAGRISERVNALPGIELRSENGAGQHRNAQPIQLVTEHSAGQHVGQGHSVAAPAVVAASTDSSSFSWTDAGIGAGGAVFVILLIGGVVTVQRHSGRTATQS